jgi:GR25 family glycosyltransferase involved in LPS biosynthesis
MRSQGPSRRRSASSLPLIDPPDEDNCTHIDAPVFPPGHVLSRLGIFQLQAPGTAAIDTVRFRGSIDVRRLIEDELHIPVHLIDGVNMANVSLDRAAGECVLGGPEGRDVSRLVAPGVRLASGRFGATLSHVLLLESFLTMDQYDFFMILEDDAILCHDWATRLRRYLDHLPSDVEMARIYIDPFEGGKRLTRGIEYSFSRRNRICGNPYTAVCTGQFGQIAHIFTRAGAAAVLRTVTPIYRMPIDSAILKMTQAKSIVSYIPYADGDTKCFAISHPTASRGDIRAQQPLILAGPTGWTSLTKADDPTAKLS